MAGGMIPSPKHLLSCLKMVVFAVAVQSIQEFCGTFTSLWLNVSLRRKGPSEAPWIQMSLIGQLMYLAKVSVTYNGPMKPWMRHVAQKESYYHTHKLSFFSTFLLSPTLLFPVTESCLKPFIIY